MKFEKTKFDGVLVLSPKIFRDKRGFFYENYSEKLFLENDIKYRFVQDTHSFSSTKNTFRGFHYQMNPKAQTKLLRVLTGEILDFVIDIRKNSPTYGEYISQILSGINHKQMLIPKGFAHGFLTLSDNVNVLYKMDEFYAPEHERTLNIKSMDLQLSIKEKDIIISDKDRYSSMLESIDNNFIYNGSVENNVK